MLHVQYKHKRDWGGCSERVRNGSMCQVQVNATVLHSSCVAVSDVTASFAFLLLNPTVAHPLQCEMHTYRGQTYACYSERKNLPQL